MYYACDSATIIYQRRKKRGGLWGWGVQGLEPPKHFRWGAENPKIRKIVAQVTAIVAIVAKFYGGGSLDR